MSDRPDHSEEDRPDHAEEDGPAGAPDFAGALAADAGLLARHAAGIERMLALLPPGPDRTGTEAEQAARLHEECRAARHAFLARHAEAVYDGLTAGRTRRPRLADLAADAALRFPGLVPDAAQLAEERGRLQAHKEGREIDQGIFFGALLRSPPRARTSSRACCARPPARPPASRSSAARTGWTSPPCCSNAAARRPT
nr:hypothetical protein [Streptomyces sp. I6]